MSRLFNFAWVNAIETTFGPEHEVEDLEVVTFSRTQEEGDFATLSVVVKNPRVGLLNIGRKQWLWFSQNGSGTDGAEPLFFGRLVGIPTDMAGEKVTLTFTAKPSDYEDQKSALAATLRVLPNYDPIFVDEKLRTDSDAVLEGYSASYHSDPITHVVTISDWLTGEAGIVSLGEGDVAFNNFSTTLEQAPLTSVSMDATVNWPQQFTGTIDLGTQTIISYTGDGIISDWPQPGATLSGGWSALSASAIDVDGVGSAITANWTYNYQNNAKEHVNGDTVSITFSQSQPVLRGSFLTADLTDKEQIGINAPNDDPPLNIPATRQITSLIVPRWQIATSLVLAYGANRQRSERMKFTLTSDLQPILTDPAVTDTSDLITKNGADVSLPVPDNSTAGTEIPIGDPLRRSYFDTARGLLSLEYLLLVARAHLLWRARVVKIPFKCSFNNAKQMTLRHNVELSNRYLPGGTAVGKLVSLTLSFDGNQMFGTGTMACAIGFGNSITEATGTNDYIDDDYIDPDYYSRTGEVVAVASGTDLAYTPPLIVPNDDGLVFPLTKADAVISDTIVGDLATQEAAIIASFTSEQIIAQLAATPSTTKQLSIDIQQTIAQAGLNSTATALKNNPLYRRIELKNLTDVSFDTEFQIDVAQLTVPKQIDLQAS